MIKNRNKTYHFIVNLMEMDFTNFIYNIFALKCDKPKTWNKKVTLEMLVDETAVSDVVYYFVRFATLVAGCLF